MINLNVRMEWTNTHTCPSKRYVCAHCGSDVSPTIGFTANASLNAGHPRIYVCHHCTRPTFFDYDGTQTPGPTFGDPVSDISDDGVAKMYEEARACISANAHTAAVLCCRKLLMHIAVSKGAPQGEPFIKYVEYLAAQNYIPPDARTWVDQIRTQGNEANHEIKISSPADAQELVSFAEMLLKVIFEFPAKVGRRKKT